MRQTASSTGSSQVHLIAQDVAVARGVRLVVDGVSFTLARGEALVLTGPNGAGKTTLLRAIAGFLNLTRGSIELQGGDPERTLAEQCHFVGHLNGLKPNLTVAENVRFWGDYLTDGPVSQSLVDRSLDSFGLTPLADIATGYLSAGQKRRAGLARLLVVQRPLWLLDEPSVSLDAASIGILTGLIKCHLGAGGLVIAATHTPLGISLAEELQLSASGTASSVTDNAAGVAAP